MKIIFLLVACSLFFFSCESSTESNNIQTQNGLIHKIEASTWMYGTHTLDDSSGKPLFALTSSTIDLSIYESKQVNISGNLVEGYPVDGGPKYLNVISISVIK